MITIKDIKIGSLGTWWPLGHGSHKHSVPRHSVIGHSVSRHSVSRHSVAPPLCFHMNLICIIQTYTNITLKYFSGSCWTSWDQEIRDLYSEESEHGHTKKLWMNSKIKYIYDKINWLSLNRHDNKCPNIPGFVAHTI